MYNLNRWLRSKSGLVTIASVIVVLMALTTVGQVAGWWDIGALFGTAGLVPTNPEFPAPTGGYTCLPTCQEDDGKFLTLVGENMKSLSGVKIVAWIAVPGNADSIQISIFDGDSGKDNTGAVNYKSGNWDSTEAETTYTLYADPLKDGSGAEVIGTWHGNADPMPNNGWYDIQINKSELAKGPSGHYFYRFEADRGVAGSGINAFKLRSTAYLSTGKSLTSDNPVGIVGMVYNTNDAKIVYPNWGGVSNPGPSNYTGDWAFSIYIPAEQDTFEIWDGDFDRGTKVDEAADTDDPNTDGKPPFANEYAVDEGSGGKGAPADNYTAFPLYLRDPAVTYELIDPGGAPIYINDEPSGTEEWEKFSMSTNPDANPDLLVDRIQPGFYVLHIQGLDLYNSVWFSTGYEICDAEDGCGPRVWDGGGCALPLSYWTKNFNRLYKNKGSAAQETKESIEWGLRNTALVSPLFRSGINASAPAAIDNPAKMTPQEAMDILQAKNTGKKSDKQLSQALKNLLSAYLNLGTGKMNPDSPAYLNVYGGMFEGTVMEALKEAENIILYGGELKRAIEIAEFITYGGTYEERPMAPVPPAPAPVVPPPAADPSTCGARSNDYTVESPATAPFNGVRFNFAAGTEIVNSDYDEYRIVLSQEAADSLTSVQMAADVIGISGQVTLEGCNFAGALPCGEPMIDDSNNLAFYFMGAVDNGDGTLTLIFNVQNFSNQPLQSVTIGLPDGMSASGPVDTYQSQVCP